MPTAASRMERSPRWPEFSQKPKPYCPLNWNILPVKPITAHCGYHGRNLSLWQVIREPDTTNVALKSSVCSAREEMVWRAWWWSVKQGAPQSWRWVFFYCVRALLALMVVSLRQPGSRQPTRAAVLESSTPSLPSFLTKGSIFQPLQVDAMLEKKQVL